MAITRVRKGEPPKMRKAKESYHYECKLCGQPKSKQTGHSQTLFPSDLSVPVREKDQVLMTFVHYYTTYCTADILTCSPPMHRAIATNFATYSTQHRLSTEIAHAQCLSGKARGEDGSTELVASRMRNA
ncbi:unnamed protein product [Leuciscus chuanchicus]